ncbi:hypothetical protein H9L21_06365 [Aeromicrobium senzhongii]|uniref:Uncharacterized protein n=1 Tax=Aeromicrobium senzhongii TaxID=2663859 RepID=A0ABX6SWS5_9ACTN|nr:hypothetical protein [Aeromicrobium senzhongii]MTB87410.1 hypothetical protein [Aeromicrobium senzhongii]QNL95533.1 hypothetical protein H9L21_06365 [Aeromicrobium senzhongii]
MNWLTRPRARERSVALALPTPDGDTWPPADPAARHGFGASTIHRLGTDAAFTPRAHEIADLLTARLLPLLAVDSSPTDLPHVVQLLRSAAQAGAGIGIVDARDGAIAADRMGADAAGALGEAERDLPPMPAALRVHARYLMHAGHHVARLGPGVVDDLETELRARIPHP